MDILDKYLKEIDESDLDHTNQIEIEGKFQSIRDEFEKNENKVRALNAQLEMEVFSFTKKVENFDLKLSFRFSGTGKNDAGEDIPFEWPDSNYYKDAEYNYVLKRFNETKNDFIKFEYGFLLLLGANSIYKRDEIALQVLDSLINMIINYIELVKNDNIDSKHYGMYLLNLFEISLILSIKRKKNNIEFETKLITIKDLIYTTLKTWNPKNRFSRLVTDISHLLIYFHKEFKDYDLTKISDKIWDISQELQNSYREGSIEVAFIGLEFSRKINYLEKHDWYRFIANNYELLADSANSKKDNLLYCHFIESALNTYKIIKDDEKIKNMNVKFIQAKTQGGYSTIRTPIPEEVIKESNDRVDKFTNENDETEIIYTLATTPMITSIKILKEETKKSYNETPLIAMISKSVIDKMGNKVAEYKHNNKEELFHFNLLNFYGLNFQFISDEISHLFIEAIRKKKLSYAGVNEYISNSWLGKDFERYYNGYMKILNISKSLNNSIKNIFYEIQKIIIDNKYEPNFVSSIDSLTLRFEYIFRFLCENLGIPTYFQADNNIKQERSLNSLIEDQILNEKFIDAGLEDDLFLFKYIFTEKAGWNLRNKVAHGLMDFDEYNYKIAIILVVLILKISSYNFKQT